MYGQSTEGLHHPPVRIPTQTKEDCSGRPLCLPCSRSRDVHGLLTKDAQSRFTCPLVINGKDCMKRVGMLYQPPGGSYFGCRQCYDLVYQSSRESHKWDSMWKRLGIQPSIGKMVGKRWGYLPSDYQLNSGVQYDSNY